MDPYQYEPENENIDWADPDIRAEVVEHLLLCALWTADEDIVEQHPGEFDASPYTPRLSDSAKARATQVVDEFLSAPGVAHMLSQTFFDPHEVGHDLYLTAGGHGTGFWDRHSDGTCTEEQGDMLTKQCKRLSIGSIYQGDDGQLYLG